MITEYKFKSGGHTLLARFYETAWCLTDLEIGETYKFPIKPNVKQLVSYWQRCKVVDEALPALLTLPHERIT